MSKPIDNGGPAFPCETEWRNQHLNGIEKHAGMSLRDWFAGQALVGLVFHNDYGTVSDQDIAKGAYSFADAMLAAALKPVKEEQP